MEGAAARRRRRRAVSLSGPMRFPLRQAWSAVRSSLWFVPALMVLAAVLLAGAMVILDDHLDLDVARRYPRLFGAHAQAAREILAAIAASMITVAGVTFSITIVALSLAANQYTSRILRTYMADRGNQVVLGMFVSVFVYCVLVLRTISGDDDQIVPSYALFVGMVLGLVAIGFLIYFIHHIARSIQVSTILANIHRETLEAIDDIVRRHAGREAGGGDVAPADAAGVFVDLPGRQTGYLQDIDEDRLVEWADARGAVIELRHAVGDFLISDAPLLRVHGLGELTAADRHTLWHCHGIHTAPTIEQDPAYGLRQIVDIALKAISPAINDTTTAVSCIDYLGAIVYRLLPLELPSQFRSRRGRLCLVTRRITLQWFIELGFTEIRQHAGTNPAIYHALVRTLVRVGSQPAARPHQATLWLVVCQVAESAAQHIRVGSDRAALNEALAAAAREFGRGDTDLRL